MKVDRFLWYIWKKNSKEINPIMTCEKIILLTKSLVVLILRWKAKPPYRFHLWRRLLSQFRQSTKYMDHLFSKNCFFIFNKEFKHTILFRKFFIYLLQKKKKSRIIHRVVHWKSPQFELLKMLQYTLWYCHGYVKW